ncbi:unnamed protein product [Mucor hiemalis]
MSTAINMQEKVPLLPVNTEEECPRIECYKNKVYKRKYKRQACLFVFMVIAFFLQNDYHNRIYNDLKRQYGYGNNNDGNVNSYLSIQNVADANDIALYNENQMVRFAKPIVSAGYYSCNDDKPSIPFEGLSTFEFDPSQFSGLTIKQNTNNRYGSFSIGAGEAKVVEDKSISKVTVNIDIKFNQEELQDIFWIDQKEDANDYTLVIKADDGYRGSDACVTIDVTVRVPAVDSLDKFSLSLANSAIILDKDLSLEELSVSVANGFVEFDDLTTGKTSINVANGHVSGSVKTLDDDFNVSIANGHANIAIKEIDQSKNDAIPLKVSIANGHIDFQVPTDFESTFQLSSYVGRRIVESSKPQAIHRKESGWGSTSGYYGNDSTTKNSISLSASSGSLHLNYA